MKCKVCESDGYIVNTKNVRIFLDENYLCYEYNNGEIGGQGVKQIKYCPKCGRKLDGIK